MILKARCVLPVEAPPIENGAVEIDGARIVDVGRAGDLAGRGPVEDLGDVVLMPGLINAHTHLELTCYGGRLPPAPLWEWLDGLIALRRAPGLAQREHDAILDGARQSIVAGVTCVADISRSGRHVDALRDSPIRKVCFIELISGASPPGDADQLLAAVKLALPKVTDRMSIGISPHAPYTVTWDDLRRAASIAAENDLPVTMHVAETPEELEWLATGGGRAQAFLEGVGLPTASSNVRGGFVDLLHRASLTAQRPLLAHVNYLTDDQLRQLTASGCSVAYCPRAHAFFGHAPHRWCDMLAAGVNVCLGTDSLASNQSLSILDEMRFLKRAAPAVSGDTLLEMATIRAARALGIADEIGSIRFGKSIDLVAVAARDLDTALSAEAPVVRDVWIGGSRIVAAGAYVTT